MRTDGDGEFLQRGASRLSSLGIISKEAGQEGPVHVFTSTLALGGGGTVHLFTSTLALGEGGGTVHGGRSSGRRADWHVTGCIVTT